MENLEENIWNFGQLNPSEQAKVEAFVDGHPEYKGLLEESKSIYRLLEEAGLFASNPPHDIALAYLVANNLMHDHPLPEPLERSFRQLKDKIETMPHEQQRYDTIRARMEEIATNADPVAQFEQLTGYDLESDFVLPDLSGKASGNKKEDRPPLARRKGRRYRVNKPRFMVPLVLFMVAITFVWQQNSLKRNAYTDAEVLLVDGYNHGIRGLEMFEEPVSSDVVFMFAQRALHEAQHVWFGLYYTYDDAKLDEAEALLLRVLGDVQGSAYLKEEAMYLLGKVYMAQNKREEARHALNEVIDLRGRRSSEAARLQAML